MTVGPLPLPGRTGVRITGDFYQWLLVWQGCVIALHHQAQRVKNPIIAVGVEADDVGNLDDIIWWRETPAHSYFQAKYAVDSSTPINTDYLTSLSPSGGPSILRKIALAWLDLSSGGAPVDLAIVTNRAPDPTDVLLIGRDGRTKLLMPRAAQQGRSSRRGRARSKWVKESGLNEAQFLAMLSVLRFELARDLTDVEEKTSLLMKVAGLRGDMQAVRDGANWVAQQVRDGRQRFDLDMIHEALKELNLREGPSRAVLSVATLKPDPLVDQAVHTLDWFERFHGADAYSKRRPEPPATWQQLQDDIEAIPRHLGNVSQVALTGSPAPSHSVRDRYRVAHGDQCRPCSHATGSALGIQWRL